MHPLLKLILSACALTACAPVRSAAGDACIDVDEGATSCPAAEDVDVSEAFVPDSCDGPRGNGCQPAPRAGAAWGFPRAMGRQPPAVVPSGDRKSVV